MLDDGAFLPDQLVEVRIDLPGLEGLAHRFRLYPVRLCERPGMTPDALGTIVANA